VHYEYDALGRLKRTYTGLSDPSRESVASDGKAVTDTRYSYDTLGRLDAVTVVERFDTPLTTPEVTDYVYDLLGNLDQVRMAGGVVSDYDYDELNRLTLLRQFNDDGDFVWESGVDTLLAEYDYDLLADGKRSGVTETDHAGNTTRIDWLYDDIGRLTRESYDSYDNDLDFIADYTFDLVGNRLTKQTDTDPTFSGDPTFDETITYEYDANDRLLTEAKDVAGGSENDRFTEYNYGDANEKTQQTKKTVTLYTDGSGGTLEQTAYAYNLQGRMATVTIDSNGDGTPETQLAYEYNDNGIRTAQTKTTDGNADGDFVDPEDTSERTDYLIDEHNPTGYAQVLEEWLDGTLAKTYTIGHDVFAEAAAAGVIRRLLKDGHGSTRMLVDAAGLPLSGQIYRFDAYGNPIGFDPALALTTLLYNSEQFDWRTGLSYLRARYYDPASGRFNRLDPLAGNLNDPQSLHKYLFVHGDPIQGIDPTGQMTVKVLAGMVGRAMLSAMQFTFLTLPRAIFWGSSSWGLVTQILYRTFMIGNAVGHGVWLTYLVSTGDTVTGAVDHILAIYPWLIKPEPGFNFGIYTPVGALKRYKQQVNANPDVPAEVLGAILLAELRHYNVSDTLSNNLSGDFSIGIAQIRVSYLRDETGTLPQDMSDEEVRALLLNPETAIQMLGLEAKYHADQAGIANLLANWDMLSEEDKEAIIEGLASAHDSKSFFNVTGFGKWGVDAYRDIKENGYLD